MIIPYPSENRIFKVLNMQEFTIFSYKKLDFVPWLIKKKDKQVLWLKTCKAGAKKTIQEDIEVETVQM